MYLWTDADHITVEYMTKEDTLSHGIYTYGLFAALGADGPPGPVPGCGIIKHC